MNMSSRGRASRVDKEEEGDEDGRESSDRPESPDASTSGQPEGEDSELEDEPAGDGRREPVSDSSSYLPADEEYAQEDTDPEAADSSEDEVAGTTRGKQPTRPPKRAASPSLETGRRRSKKARKLINADYVDLLNDDIEHAVYRYVPGDQPSLPRSQLGLTVWTSVEKEIFFEALCRLGQDDLEGIADRMKTKSLVEIRQYLLLLREVLARRHMHDGRFAPLQLADFPAAIEVGDETSQALDQEAEAVADNLRRRELAQHRARWGDDWLVSHSNCKDMTERAEEAKMPFMDLFKVENWLKLSELCFMNSPQEDGAWQTFGDLPSIHTTTLEDFLSLADQFTRRLVLATLYVSMSRIRSKRVPASRAKNFVRKKDVAAAVTSLGLPTDRKLFWIGLARRHGLAVYETLSKKTRQGVGDPLQYTEVERALSAGVVGYTAPYEPPPPDPPSSDDEEQGDSTADMEDDVEEEGGLARESNDDGDAPENNAMEHDGAISAAEKHPEAHREALEVTRYSAIGFPRTTRAFRALTARIKAEWEEEEYADWVDQQASRDHDARIWADVLKRQPSERLAKLEERMRPETRGTLEDFHPVGRNWRDKLTYVSRWEAGFDDIDGRADRPVTPSEGGTRQAKGVGLRKNTGPGRGGVGYEDDTGQDRDIKRDGDSDR